VILIVDDVSEIRHAVRNIIQSILKNRIHDYKIVEAADGIEFLYNVYFMIYQEREIVFAITDQMMNFMNGSDAINIINRLFSEMKIKEFPIFILTAFQDAYNRGIVSSSKANRVLQKPLDKVTLMQTLYDCKINL
jgi:CheY-like chemotaxis protein